MHVVRYASNSSIRSTAKHFGLERKQVRDWVRNHQSYQQQSFLHTRYRVARADMCQHPAMENDLFAWIMDKRASGLCVTAGMIRAEALRLLPNGNFSASNGWLDRFMKRKRLTIRRITTSGRELPRDAPIQINQFLAKCEPYMQMDFDRDSLLNADETSIYIDPPTRQSVALIGSRRVDAVTTGQQKTRVSVCFTATASGAKLKPLILLPRKKPLKNWVPPNNVEIVYGTKGTFNESIISDHFIPKVLVDFKNQKCLHRLNLIFDQAPCHTTARAKASFNNASVNLNWVPKRMTSILQPADVAWMRPLKVAYFKKWNDWLINAPISYTQAGNRKSPGYALVVDWISEIWPRPSNDHTLLRSVWHYDSKYGQLWQPAETFCPLK